ncbi:MAG TPA: pyridoxal phosphate-dependent aminotransferase, partial [Firmicutes bacterium]|nr:pyridoxal phosphate-dependent aminotransferase [Bacillota bacterium]
VIDFTLGEPHLSHETYSVIKESLEKRMLSQHIGYSNFYGVMELRENVANFCSQQYQQNYDPENEMIITTGCSESLSAVLMSLINPFDEVIILEPAFSLYQSIVTLCGGTVVTYNLHQTNMRLHASKLNELISPKTKGIIINSPNNPSGHVLSEEDLSVIYECVKDKSIFVISDEVYRDLVFDNNKYVSISAFDSLRDQLFIINGFSKTFAMTGWRVGYVLGPKQYMKKIGIVHQNLVACTSTISQYACIEALKNTQLTTIMVQYYKRNRDYVYEQLKPYVEDIIYPQGAFYLYFKPLNNQQSSLEYCKKLLLDKKVALVPSLAFESEDSGYVRLSYCCDFETLKEGIIRIQKFQKII